MSRITGFAGIDFDTRPAHNLNPPKTKKSGLIDPDHFFSKQPLPRNPTQIAPKSNQENKLIAQKKPNTSVIQQNIINVDQPSKPTPTKKTTTSEFSFTAVVEYMEQH